MNIKKKFRTLTDCLGHGDLIGIALRLCDIPNKLFGISIMNFEFKIKLLYFDLNLRFRSLAKKIAESYKLDEEGGGYNLTIILFGGAGFKV